MRRTALLTALFATPALLQEQGLAFSIGNISGTGTGCPEDSWGLFVEAGQFGFVEFNATIGLEDERPHLDCNLAIELNEVQKGHRVVLRQVNVGGRAGMDEGVQATIRTSTSWTGEEGSELSEDQVLLGSAVGIEFPLEFQAGGTFAEQASKCGDSSVELNIHVDVLLEREDDKGLGVCSVLATALRLDVEPCDVEGENPAEEAPEEEAPVEEGSEEESPAEGGKEDNECVVDGEGEEVAEPTEPDTPEEEEEKAQPVEEEQPEEEEP